MGGRVPQAHKPPPPSTAGPSSAAWPSSGRRGSGGGSSSRNTACTTTASAGATMASTAPTSTTPTRWPCAPGALRPAGPGGGRGGPCRRPASGFPCASDPLPSFAQISPGHVQEDRWDVPLLPPCVQGEGELPQTPGLPAGPAPRFTPGRAAGCVITPTPCPGVAAPSCHPSWDPAQAG